MPPWTWAKGRIRSTRSRLRPESPRGTSSSVYGGSVSSDIPFDAAPAVIKSALASLTGIGPDDIDVLQDAPGDPWTVDFTGNLAGLPPE